MLAVNLPEPAWQYLCKVLYWASYELDDAAAHTHIFKIIQAISKQANLTPRPVTEEELDQSFQETKP